MRRFFSADPRLVLLLVLAVLGAFAWLTRHPDSELLRRAEQWPWVGSLASGFRSAYGSAPKRGEPVETVSRSGAAAERIEAHGGVEGFDRARARQQVWVEPGIPVQVAPDPDSEILARTEFLGNYSLTERRGEWFRIYRYFADDRVLDGWVLLEDYEEPSTERLQRPDPVLPLAAVPPDAKKLRRARSIMVNGGVEVPCGPYTLFTDVEGDPIVEVCGPLASQLEEVYRERYGLIPVSGPAEAIFLFRSQASYEAFISDDERIPAEKGGHAAPARGYLALHSEALPREVVTSTLLHELTHLLSRRALGPALPPWLSEGLADDLAESRLAETGRLVPGELSAYSLGSDTVVHHFGGVTSAARLIEALDDTGLPELRELVQMGSQEFHEAPMEALHYALSSFWVRYLLSGDPGSEPDGFRAYLEAVASGERVTPDLLIEHLAGDWAELEAEFRAWLRFQTLPLPRIVGFDR